MKNQIYPCLWFDGNAKEAALFYCSLFSNGKIKEDTPLVVTFELNGLKVMGLNGGPVFNINPSISFFVDCPTMEKTNELWNKLSDGAKVLMPIDKYSWSDRYGWLQDKFGMTWQIFLSNKDISEEKITPAMLFTSSQFGRAEEAIKYYSNVFSDSGTKLMFHYPPGDPNAGKVTYSEFSLANRDFIAMDGPGVHEYTFNEGVSFVIPCDTQKDIDYFWEKFTSEGEESMCGWLKDKYGVSWQVVPSMIGELLSDPERAKRVMPEVMKMKKLDLEKMISA